MTTELKPCRKCQKGGAEYTQFSTGPGPYEHITWHAYMCDRCGFTASSDYTDEGAAKEWNTRQSSPPSAKFTLGQRVTKIKGSKWTGKVVGFYSTDLTPIGYNVESETEVGSVQLWPEAALAVCPAVEPTPTPEVEAVAREMTMRLHEGEDVETVIKYRTAALTSYGAAVREKGLSSSMIFWAFRYGLGRMTYAVSEIAGYIVAHWNEIDAPHQKLILKEIEECLEKGNDGHDCDVEQWRRVLALKAQNEKGGGA